MSFYSKCYLQLLDNTNRKLRYTQFWISWNYFKAKCKLHQGAKSLFFLTKKKRFFYRKVAFQKKLIRAFLSLHCVIKIADSSSSTPRIIIKHSSEIKNEIYDIYIYIYTKVINQKSEIYAYCLLKELCKHLGFDSNSENRISFRKTEWDSIRKVSLLPWDSKKQTQSSYEIQ